MLRYDFSTIERAVTHYTRSDGSEGLTLATQSIVMLTQAVGIPRITQANAAEFFVRSRLVELLVGAYRHNGQGEAAYIEPSEVAAHIGLSTNAMPQSPAQFRRELIAGTSRSLSEQFTRATTVEVAS